MNEKSRPEAASQSPAEGPTESVPPTRDTSEPLAAVVPLHALDARRREALQLSLDHVPIALGLAAGSASVLLPADVGPYLAYGRLEDLRREWHRLVDASIGQALDELGWPA